VLLASVTNWLSRDFLLEDEGKFVGAIDGSVWREQATAILGTTTYALYREGVLRGSYIIERARQVIAYAHKTDVFRARFEVASGNQTFVLRKTSVWRQTFEVSRDGEQIGIIKPVGIFKRRGILDGAPSISLEVRVFLVWIALMMWRRQDS
jgi:hypothetical protein